MEAVDTLILAVSGFALALAIAALTRSAPAHLRTEAEEARTRSLKAEAVAAGLMSQWEAARSALNSTLGEMQEERERALRAFSRARAERQRAEQTNGPPREETRGERLDRLRRESGLSRGPEG